MTGFPLRPSRDSYGPTFEDYAPVRDPRRQVSAAAFNLLAWQTAGLGITAPRTMLRFVADPGRAIQARAESWNPNGQTLGVYAPPLVTRQALGIYRVTYPTQMADESGTLRAVSFAFAAAFCANADPTVLKNAQAAVVAGVPNELRVAVFSAAGALEDGNTVVVLGF